MILSVIVAPVSLFGLAFALVALHKGEDRGKVKPEQSSDSSKFFHHCATPRCSWSGLYLMVIPMPSAFNA